MAVTVEEGDFLADGYPQHTAEMMRRTLLQQDLLARVEDLPGVDTVPAHVSSSSGYRGQVCYHSLSRVALQNPMRAHVHARFGSVLKWTSY